MKKNVLFYGVFALVLTGAISLTTMESTQVADVATLASADNSSERAMNVEIPDSEEDFDEIEEVAETLRPGPENP